MDFVKEYLTAVDIAGIAYALITFLVGWSIIGAVNKYMPKTLAKTKLDDTLKPFVTSLIIIGAKVILIVTVIGMLGVENTSFVAILGAASFAVGLAFQGTLSNFAGGVLLITLRPFKVGDVISAAGFTGTVEAVHIFNTVIVTPDNKVALIPNGTLSNTSILNYSIKDTRRVDLNFGVGYDADIDRVKSILSEIIANQPGTLSDPAPFVAVSEHADSAVIFVVRVWVNAADFWAVHFGLLETVKKRFDQENISIPYPQMDVHLDK
ncbi:MULTISPECIES: mechanosensitive ion channel family protein [unclassified Fusibacter]|uniref:mechanosensitive ion channel family protein n=1 Tax=unclassified Fusibacter TaxID=2624464 RepID=UPI001010B9DD|nr:MULTISPECIES: mechanosensitive ion channel domain-containing protein [unclassified Fusibacter]MCK8059323.1 mechanosensitive ion channel [Fusibacter sp. A2]NPE21213.1 mechanosensitive ion channel [Fusibacter sp. A1]RXV62481.1 mechanosensitive ion channel family protein [Fusibacter sp. A1]